MALVQRAKTPGTITAVATISRKQLELRPQVAVWQGPILKGASITGLWIAASEPETMAASFLGSPRIFALTPGRRKTDRHRGRSGGWFGSDAPRVIFKSGANVFEGKIKEEQLDLQRSVNLPWSLPAPKKPDPNGPVIGPAPDGSDPSFDISDFASVGRGMSVRRKGQNAEAIRLSADQLIVGPRIPVSAASV